MKRWKIKLLLLCFSLAVALTTVELGLRLAGFSRPYFYTFDEELGWDLRPDVSGWFRKEGEAYIHINSSGRRDDRQYTTTKPGDTFRVAVIGDSYAEAFQVPVAQTFWSVLERELGKCSALSGKRAEVLNFGVSSYGTAQELVMLRKRVWAFSPDVVLLAFASVNDVRNNSRQLEQDELRPYFVFQNGELVADMSFRDSPRFRQKQTRLNQTMYRLINHSRLLQLINGMRDDLLTRRAIAQGSYQGATNATEIGVDDSVYKEPTDQAWQQAWQVTEGLLSQMNKEVTAKGAKFMVVTLTAGPQVSPDASSRQSYMARLGITDLFYPERRIQAVADREHFPILTLAPAFIEYADQHKVALHGFGDHLNLGHWNAEGHRVAGERISQKLCELIVADASKTKQESIGDVRGGRP